MSEDFSFSITGSLLVAVPRRRDRPWGHGLEIDICNADGTTRATATFACHPEFAEYGQCQAMTTGELVGAVKERIDKVFAEQCVDASARGMTLGGRINSPTDVWDTGNSLTGSPIPE